MFVYSTTGARKFLTIILSARGRLWLLLSLNMWGQGQVWVERRLPCR